MSLFSTRLENVLCNAGYDVSLAKRAAKILQPGKTLTFNQFVEKLSPEPPSKLALLLADLAAAHVVDQIIRVESPETHSGIKDFETLDEVPTEIYDEYTGKVIDVTPQNVVVLYKAQHGS